MTTTTKLFVILTCLFVFIFTPLSVQFAARTHDWRQYATRLEDATRTALAHQASARAVAKAEIEHCMDLRDRERETVRRLETQVIELESRLAELTQELAQLARDRDSWKTSTELQIAQGAILTQHNKELTETKDRLTRSENELQARNRDLMSRIQELSADLVMLSRQLRQRQQEMASCRQENEALREQMRLGTSGQFEAVTRAPTAEATSPVARSPITGQVTEVRGQLATISVGSAAGVKEGMLMVAIRGDDYICDLRITSAVEPNEAVGEIVLTGSSGHQLRPNDIVVDANSFSTR